MQRESPIFLFLALSGAAVASQTMELRVSATIPPRPCQYPQICEPAPQAAQSKMIFSGGSVLYVGSTPEVHIAGDLVTVIF
jgi:hypothetical protein